MDVADDSPAKRQSTKMPTDSIQQIISNVAAQHASRVAIERGDRTMSYMDLENESNRLANFLISAGANGSVVVILAADPPRIVTAILGVLKAGCVFAPFDPLMPVNRLRTMGEQIAPRWFISEFEHVDKVAEIVSAFNGDVNVVCIDGGVPKSGGDGPLTVIDEYARFTSTTRPAVESKPDDMCSIFFTSGSTGKPKGIAGRLKGIAHFALWEAGALGAGPGTRVSQLASPSFDGFLKDVFVPLCAGGTACVPESRDVAVDARRLAQWIEASGINVLHCVPSVFRSLINTGLVRANFPELRYVVLAGEPLLPVDVGRWTETFGNRIQLVNLYGPTETTVTKLFHFVSSSDKDRRSVPIGKPMPGAAAVVIDAEGHACPPGEVGEIVLRTPYRALGYYNQPQMTAEVFVPNPLSNNPDDIVYRTGDYGRVLEDGNFEFVGRKDQQVKIRGVRIELAEIENLLRGHENVRDVAVIDREDAMGNKYLCAYVVLDGKTETGALREHLAKSLPDFMMPSAIIELDTLPRIVNGKVDRKALPAPSSDKTAYVAPRTAVEEVVAGIWAEVLGVEQVGVEDNFFDLGGHSLLATQVMSRVSSALRADVPLRRLFEDPTVAQLSAAVEATLRDGAARTPRIERVPRGGALPLSFAQQRLWFLDQLEAGSAFYNVPAAVRLSGALKVDVLEAALGEVVRRHEALRTSFPTVGDHPVQLIAAELELPFDVIDLCELSGREQDEAIASHASDWSSLPFDLAHGPLLRVRLLRLGATEHVLLFCMHHVAGDLWSMNVLVREWAMLYDAFSQEQPSPLSELPVQYADYAVWQRNWLRGRVLEEQLDYWRKQLNDAPAVLSLPADKSCAAHNFEGVRLNVALPGSLSSQVKALSRREGATLFMTLLAAFGATLHHHAQQTDILVGTPVANRQQAEVENLIGLFLNTLVLRLDLSGDPTFRELLRRVREVSLGAYGHQDVPFEKLVEELRPDRSLHHNPLFQVAFTLDQPPAVQTTLSGLTLTPVEMDKGMVQFHLILHLVDAGENIAGTLQYQTALFEANTMQRLFRHFETILAKAVETPEMKLSTFASVLTEADRELLAENRKQVAAFSSEKLKTARRRAVAV